MLGVLTLQRNAPRPGWKAHQRGCGMQGALDRAGNIPYADVDCDDGESAVCAADGGCRRKDGWLAAPTEERFAPARGGGGRGTLVQVNLAGLALRPIVGSRPGPLTQWAVMLLAGSFRCGWCLLLAPLRERSIQCQQAPG